MSPPQVLRTEAAVRTLRTRLVLPRMAPSGWLRDVSAPLSRHLSLGLRHRATLDDLAVTDGRNLPDIGLRHSHSAAESGLIHPIRPTKGARR